MSYATNALDGSQVWFEDQGGDGTPVVILGGLLDPVAVVRRAPIAQALQDLSAEFRLVYVDHRGHGRSATPHDPASYAMPVRVADVTAVLDTLRLDRVHVVGISWGGRLGFGLVEHAPERLRSLVAMGQQPFAIDPEGPLAQLMAGAMAASEERGITALVEAFEVIAGRYPEPVRAEYLACDPAAIRAAWVAVMGEGAVSQDLGAWRVRCLICVAADDVDFFDQARRAAGLIPGARFRSIADQDHLGLDTAPVDQVLPTVLQVLRGG